MKTLFIYLDETYVFFDIKRENYNIIFIKSIILTFQSQKE